MNTTDNHHIDLTKEILYEFPNGGKVVVYNSIDRTANDFQRIVSCVVFFAEQGKQVVLTPKFSSPLKSEPNCFRTTHNRNLDKRTKYALI